MGFSVGEMHFVRHYVWSLLSIAIVSIGEPVVLHSLMELYFIVDCFPSELEWCLRVGDHPTCFLCSLINHSISDSILIVCVRLTELEGSTMCGQEHSDEPLVILACSIIAPKMLDVVSSGINSGLEVLVGGDASLLGLIRTKVYGGPSGAIVNK